MDEEDERDGLDLLQLLPQVVGRRRLPPGVAQLLDLAPQVTAPSLHHFGTADDYIDGPTVERIREAVTAGDATVEVQTYEGAAHAFDNSDFVLHHPSASALAWERTLAFLARELPVS